MQDAATEVHHQWGQDLDPLLRNHVFEKIKRKLAQVYHGQLDSAEDLNMVASRFENKVFREAKNKEDYLRRISLMLLRQEQKQKQKLLQRATSGHRQLIQMGSHGTHGGNSSSTAMSQVASMMSTQGRQSSQLQGQPMTPLSQQMVQSVATQNSEQLAMQLKPTNFSGCNPIHIAQPQGQPLVQPNVQLNPILRINDRGTSMLPQEQMMVNEQGLGFNQQPMDKQKYQMLVAQHANVTKMHNAHPGAQNIQPGVTVGLQSTLKMHGQEALNELIQMELQPMALPQQLINVSQQNKTMGSAGEVDWRKEMIQKIKPLKDAYLSEFIELDQVVFIPELTERQLESLPTNTARQYKFIVTLKNKLTLILKFLRLEKSDIPDKYRGQLSMFLKTMQDVLGFYRRSKARATDAHRPQISHGQPQMINHCGSQAPSGSGASHQKQQEESAHSQLSEKIITTTLEAQQMNSNRLLGVGSSYSAEKYLGSVQSLPIDKLQECRTLTLSPVIESVSGIVEGDSPADSLKPTSPSPVAEAAAPSSVLVKSTSPSPVANAEAAASSCVFAVKVASPCASANSTLPSDFAESASIQADSPCASAKSTLPSPFAKPGAIEATSPVTDSVQPASPEDIDSFLALLLEDLAAAGAQAPVGETETNTANGYKQVTTTDPIMPALPLQAETADHRAEDNEHTGNEIPAAKKPIDRLLDAVRASSPAMLRSAADSVCSVLTMNDWVPNMEMDAFQDCGFFSQQCGSSTVNKMKRDFESTSAPLGGMDGSFMTFDSTDSSEGGAKRHQTQNAEDTLLDEINSANIMLIDTFISIADDNGTDGITSGHGGTLVKLFYTATSLAPDLVSLIATSGTSIVMPVKLLVPADYPRSSPVLVCDQGDEQMRKSFSEISGAADIAFRHALCGLAEPMSVMDIARAWEASVRKAIAEFAQRHGGGTFSSRYGEWTRC